MFASGSPSYRSMCDLIIQKRPDLFRQGLSWNYWSLVASCIILCNIYTWLILFGAVSFISTGIINILSGNFGYGFICIYGGLWASYTPFVGVMLAYTGYKWKNQRAIAEEMLKHNPPLEKEVIKRARSRSRSRKN